MITLQEQIAVMQAYEDGKKIECKPNNMELWEDATSPAWNWGMCDYRIKEEPHYRPFKNAEECWNGMLRHAPFGWIKDETTQAKYLIYKVDDMLYIDNDEMWTYKSVLECFTFADGTPFGIKED